MKVKTIKCDVCGADTKKGSRYRHRLLRIPVYEAGVKDYPQWEDICEECYTAICTSLVRLRNKRYLEQVTVEVEGVATDDY